MHTVSGRLLMMAAALAASLLLGACGDDTPSEPADGDCIGPAGGSVAVTDSSDLLCGVSLSVEPGAWPQCWSVYFGYHSTFSTPNFPDGMEGYEGWLTGSVELEIGRATGPDWTPAPEPIDFELTFPLRGLTVEPGWKIMAFRYDEEADLYRLAPPLRTDATSVTVAAHRHRQLWTWGKVDLAEIDFDTYLAPLMEEMFGTAGWLEIQAELDLAQAQIMENHRMLTCEAVHIVQGALVAAGEAAADNVREIQDALHGSCGLCDATTAAFYDQLSDYLTYRAGQFITDLFTGDSNDVFLRIYGILMNCYLEYSISQLDCDYPCFADAVHLDFYVQLGLSATCYVAAGVIDFALANGFIDCP